MDIKDLKFDEKGLIPAVVQDFYTKKVLTVAYMNAESLAVTLEKKLTCFFSRSRQELWHVQAFPASPWWPWQDQPHLYVTERCPAA